MPPSSVYMEGPVPLRSTTGHAADPPPSTPGIPRSGQRLGGGAAGNCANAGSVRHAVGSASVVSGDGTLPATLLMCRERRGAGKRSASGVSDRVAHGPTACGARVGEADGARAEGGAEQHERRGNGHAGQVMEDQGGFRSPWVVLSGSDQFVIEVELGDVSQATGGLKPPAWRKW